MQNHFRIFLLIMISSISIIAFAAPPGKLKRVFSKPLTDDLTQEEEETKNKLFKLLTEKLCAKFAGAHDAIVEVKPEPVTDPNAKEEEEEVRGQILYTNNIKPSEIKADLKKTDPDIKQMLRRQIDLALQASHEKNALMQALKQEETRKEQEVRDSRKKLKAPAVMKNLLASTLESATTSVTDMPTLLTMPSLSVSVESITTAELHQSDSILQDVPHSSPPAVPSFADLDDLMASLDAPFAVASCESQEPQEVITFERPRVDLVTMLQDVQRKLVEVSKTAEVFASNNPKVNNEFTFELQALDTLTDNLVPYLKLKPEEENLPALNRLKGLVASIRNQNDKIPQNNKKVARITEYNAYMSSLECLQETLALAK